MNAQKARSTGGTHLLGYTVDENKKYVIDYQHVLHNLIIAARL